MTHGSEGRLSDAGLDKNTNHNTVSGTTTMMAAASVTAMATAQDNNMPPKQ